MCSIYDPSPLPPSDETTSSDAPVRKKRPKPGERRLQILHTMAAMLEQPKAERLTTAALAARLDVSEAGLYRHFASKAQMYEALIDFIESSVYGKLQQIDAHEADPPARAAHIATVVLQFGERNPGMARVMAGDALVGEHERLQQRMTQFFDKLETTFRRCLHSDTTQVESVLPAPDADAHLKASVLVAYMVGRLQRFARSDFRHRPTELLEPALHHMLSKKK
jgi:TetR/AcrR family transcriptional regulator